MNIKSECEAEKRTSIRLRNRLRTSKDPLQQGRLLRRLMASQMWVASLQRQGLNVHLDGTGIRGISAVHELGPMQ